MAKSKIEWGKISQGFPMQAINQAKEISFVAVEEIIPHEKNMNKHSAEQMDRLEKIIKYQGFRVPLIISNLSNKLICGHARLEIAKRLGMKEVPVIYQDFKNSDQEYAALVSQNAIALWAELDLSAINSEIENLGPDLDLDLLGFKDFELEPADKEEKEIKKDKFITCPECFHEFEVN